VDSVKQQSQASQVAIPLPEPAEIQPDLIELPATQRKRDPDPLAKPTWEQWQTWDVFRRLLNDHRLRGHDAAFKLWHWYHNCKDASGEVSGFRAKASWICKKFGWSRATYFATNQLLYECQYLSWRATEGCKNIFRTARGIRELPADCGQLDFPFKIPASAEPKATGTPDPSRSSPTGTPDPSRSSPTGTPGVPLGQARSSPASTPPYTMCEVHVIEGSVKEGSLPLPKREDWKILGDIDRNRREMAQLLKPSSGAHSLETKNAIMESRLLEVSNLQRELASLPPEGKGQWKQRHEEERRLRLAKSTNAVPADPTPPERYEELLAELRRAVEEPNPRGTLRQCPDRNAGTYNAGTAHLYDIRTIEANRAKRTI
jgi:hypothetical protein